MRDLLLVDDAHWDVDGKCGRDQRHCEHHPHERHWHVQLEGPLEELEELERDHGREQEANDTAKDERREDDRVLLVEEETRALLRVDADRSQTAVLPDVLANVRRGRYEKEEEG